MQVAYYKWTDAEGVKEEGDYPDAFPMQTDMVSFLAILRMQLVCIIGPLGDALV